MSISISQAYDWLRKLKEDTEQWASENGHLPGFVFISRALYTKILTSGKIYLQMVRPNGTLVITVNFEGRQYEVKVAVTSDIDELDANIHALVLGENESVEEALFERMVLCDTAGASTVDTVTTTEKTESEE